MSERVIHDYLYPGLSRAALFIVLLALVQGLYAVDYYDTDVTKPDTATEKNAKSKHNIYASAGAGYNLIYMGSSLSQDKPYYSGGLIYGFKNEFFVSAYGVHLNVFDPLISFSSFTSGYSHAFNSWLDIALSASRYQANKTLTDTLFTSFFYTDFTLGFDWKLLYTKLSAGGLFSESSSAYFQLRNSRFFQSPEIFKSKAYFSFDPYVNLLFGFLTETAAGRVLSPPYRKGGKNGNTPSSTTSRFGLMEIDFGLPVSFDVGRFTIEAEPGYTIPLYSGTTIQSAKGFVFNLGLSFRIL